MKSSSRFVALGVCCLLGSGGAFAAAPDTSTLETLSQIRDTAMNSDWAWKQLEDLTDRIGPRLSGSPQNAAAVAQVAAAMRSLGAQVRLQPVKVPHWVRGEEHAELVDYPGRPSGITQTLHLTALGGSSATPAAGLTAHVLVVHDFDELKAHAAEVRGSIVLYEVKFDQRLADNGEAGDAYGQAGRYRFGGPAAAADMGAVAALVRSVGGADYRLPHTGMTNWHEKQQPIPAAALTAEDADLVARLAAQGPVSMKLLLTPKTLPDADSANVIADWPGSELPNEYVVVSGHLDSWDLATGATDDGVGVMAAAGVIQVLRQLNVHARRTIRFIAWSNEENGGRGHAAYFDSVKDSVASHVGAIESDDGAGRSLGILASVTPEASMALQPVLTALGPIGATAYERRDGELGSDIDPLQQAGVPGFAPLVDTRHYFDYHHTAADTLDKVNPTNLNTQVATMAALAYFLAQSPDKLPGVHAP
jgi:carboxypeptidase Q